MLNEYLLLLLFNIVGIHLTFVATLVWVFLHAQLLICVPAGLFALLGAICGSGCKAFSDS